MVGWGHWIGCLYLLVALFRSTPESGTEAGSCELSLVDAVCFNGWRQDSMFDQFREKAFVPTYGDEDWWGDYLVTWMSLFLMIVYVFHDLLCTIVM